MNGQKYLRGQVWWVGTQKECDGHIMSSNRPHVIISNNKLNQTSGVLLTVPCTTAEGREEFSDIHVKCEFNGKNNIILCEQIKPINVSDIANYMLTLDEETMSQIDTALSKSIGLSTIKEDKERSVHALLFEKYNKGNEPDVATTIFNSLNNPANYEPTFVNVEDEKEYLVDSSEETKKPHKRWNKEEKEKFVSLVDEEGLNETSKKYNFSVGTTHVYYNKFKRELEV